MTSFNITTPRDFLEKLHEEAADFEQGHCQSARHALNAIMTGYHMHEWVFNGLKRAKKGFPTEWGMARGQKQEFWNFMAIHCPAFKVAGLITNGTKHFVPKPVSSGFHGGAFDPAAFSDAFDIPHLWIEHEGKHWRAEDFIRELVTCWDSLFSDYQI